jgi:8-oxo-dGTP pyrophosphatase MutT (NUDIX family)/phosphohistidine phosphatase SixA
VADESVSIRAAGVVPIRETSHGREVLVVHRPHRSDWSLPKGKLDGEEHIVTTAVRECSEETGMRPTLRAPLPTQVYRVDQRLKSVHYWVAALNDTGFVANDEVDEVRWVSAPEARILLTYEHDADLVDLAVTSPSTSPLIILRHTQATKRSDYDGADDRERPLALRGYLQANEVVELLNAYGITQVRSSPATRCMETVTPFATAISSTIHPEPGMSEEGHAGHPYAAAVRLGELLRQREATVLCTHRPVMSSLMDGLFGVAGAAEWAGLLDPRLAPGSFVVLHRTFGADGAPVITAAERHALFA